MAVVGGESVQDLLTKYGDLPIVPFLTQWAEALGKPTQEIIELCIEMDFRTLPSKKGFEWVEVEPLKTGWIHLTFRSKEHYKRHIDFSTWEDVPNEQNEEKAHEPKPE